MWFGSATNKVACNTEGLLGNGVVKILLIITHNFTPELHGNSVLEYKKLS